VQGAALLALCLLAGACGPGGRMASVAVVADRDGRGTLTYRVAGVFVDAKGPWWQATEAAAGTDLASMAPDDLFPLNVCRVERGGARPVRPLSFRLLDAGVLTFKAPGGDLEVPKVDPRAGEGPLYGGTFDEAAAGAYEEGTAYAVEASGAEVPAFGVRLSAPPDFTVDRLGFTTPGPGTAPIPSQADLSLDWSPGASGTVFYVVLETAAGAVVCRVADTGHFTVPSGALKQLLGTGRIRFERQVEAPFDTTLGGDQRTFPGWYRLAAARTYDIDVQ
ncbi:MAG: hypothetical protein D6729_04040, partial [Deltaproteobacteria bacterium]